MKKLSVLFILACLIFDAYAQNPVIPDLPKTSYMTIQPITVDNGQYKYLLNQALLTNRNDDKVFGSTMFNTTLYHYKRRKACYVNTLLVASQLPTTMDNLQDFNRMFKTINTISDKGSTAASMLNTVHTDYVKGGTLAGSAQNFINHYLRKINPKSVAGTPITTNLEHIAGVLKTIGYVEIGVDIAYSAVLREALASDLALNRLALIENMVYEQKNAGMAVDDALLDAFAETANSLKKSEDYYGALLVELTDRQRLGEFVNMGVDQALIYVKKHYMAQALTKYYSHHAVAMTSKSVATNAATLAGLYAGSLLLTYEVIDKLLEQHEIVHSAITSATLWYVLFHNWEIDYSDNDLLQAINWQLQYDYYQKMDKAFRGALPAFKDFIDNILSGEKYNKIWREYYEELADDLEPELIALDILQLNEEIEEVAGRIKVGLILDSSGSMRDSDPNNIRVSASEAIVDILKADDEVYIVDFDNSARLMNGGNTVKQENVDLKAYLQQIDASGGTNIGNGISVMTAALEAGGPASYASTGILLLTDGQGDYNGEAAWYSQNGIPIYTISYREYADANLMNKIAAETGGVYIQANDKEDVVQAFMQFYYGVSGNSNIFREEVVTDGPYETGNFYIDASATEMILYLDNVAMNGSAIDISTPKNETVNLSATEDIVYGSSYLFARIPVSEPGMYNIKIDPTIAYFPPDDMWENYQGGPNFDSYMVPSPVSFVIEVSTNTKKKVDLQMAETTMGTYDLKFKGNESDIPMKESVAELEVTSPSGTVRKYSKGYNNGKMSFIPLEGKGSYTLDIDFRAKDTDGNEVKRRYVRSLLVGDVQPGYIGSVNRKMGNYIYTEQGLYTQNREGITAEVFSQGSDLTNPVAKGYVTTVKDQSCIIELQQISGAVREGDIVILNLIQWKGDH